MTSSPPTRPPPTDATEPLPAAELHAGPVDDRLYLRPLWALPWATILLAVVLVSLSGREVRPDEMRATTALIGFAAFGLVAAVECLMLMAISTARRPRFRLWAVNATTAILGLGVTIFYGVIADAVLRDRHAAAGLFLRLDPVVDGFLGLLLPIAWGGILLIAVVGLPLADAVVAGRARRRAHDARLGSGS